MPLFEKKAEKVEVRKLSEIVFDMLSTNVPESEIITTLKQFGLNDTDARQVLEGAKAEFGKFATGKLTSTVNKMLEDKREEFRNYFATMNEATKKDLLLQLDLKMLEQRKYIDERSEKTRDEFEALKSEVFAVKVENAANVKRLEDNIEALKMRRHIRILLSVCVILLGVVMIGYFGIFINGIVAEGVTQEEYLSLGVYAAMIVAGLVLVKLGINFYLAKKKEFRQVGEIIPAK